MRATRMSCRRCSIPHRIAMNLEQGSQERHTATHGQCEDDKTPAESDQKVLTPFISSLLWALGDLQVDQLTCVKHAIQILKLIPVHFKLRGPSLSHQCSSPSALVYEELLLYNSIFSSYLRLHRYVQTPLLLFSLSVLFVARVFPLLHLLLSF